MRNVSSIALSLALLGCNGSSENPDTGASGLCDGGGGEEILVSSGIRFARAADGISDGFDLDGEVTTPGGPSGCGVADFVSPAGTPGVDNAMARMLPALEATEAQAIEALVHASVNSGDLLFVWRLSDLEDPWNDPCVRLELFRGKGVPLVGNDGRLLPGQTIALDPDIPPVEVAATLTEGVLEARDMAIHLPIQIFQAFIEFDLIHTQVRFRRADTETLTVDRFGTTTVMPEGSFAGLFGGGVATSTLQAIADGENVDGALGGLVGGLLALNSDLEPQADGTCAAVSVTFETYPIPAFIWAEAD